MIRMLRHISILSKRFVYFTSFNLFRQRTGNIFHGAPFKFIGFKKELLFPKIEMFLSHSLRICLEKALPKARNVLKEREIFV
jgi:hypothetical protein